MPVSRRLSRLSLLLCSFLAAAALFGLTGCSLPPALSKAELDSGKLSEKHPKLSPEKEKAGCRSCHREQPAK